MSRKSLILATGLAALGVTSLAGAHGGDTSLIHACVNNSSGTIKIVGANDECKKNESALDWNQTGIQGRGAAGAARAAGSSRAARTARTSRRDRPGRPGGSAGSDGSGWAAGPGGYRLVRRARRVPRVRRVRRVPQDPRARLVRRTWPPGSSAAPVSSPWVTDRHRPSRESVLGSTRSGSWALELPACSRS